MASGEQQEEACFQSKSASFDVLKYKIDKARHKHLLKWKIILCFEFWSRQRFVYSQCPTVIYQYLSLNVLMQFLFNSPQKDFEYIQIFLSVLLKC